VNRNYRDRHTRENIPIVIPVIICSLARAQGKQYTHRLLPQFLTPRSVIRLDYLLEAAALPAEGRTAERVCELLGCLDPRTARRRVAELGSAINRVMLELSHRRSSTPELGAVPTSDPDTTPLDHLQTLYRSEREAQDRAGRAAAALPALVTFVQAAMRKLPAKKPSSCVSPAGCPP